jgi:hypothetical protein
MAADMRLRPLILLGHVRRYTASAVNCHDADTLAYTEYFTLAYFLYIGTCAAVVFTHRNLYTVGTGEAFFGSCAKQTASDSTYDGGYIATPPTAHATAGDTAYCSTGTCANGRFGSFNLDGTQGRNGTHAYSLYLTGFIT